MMKMNWWILFVSGLLYDTCLSFYYNVPVNFEQPGNTAKTTCENGKNQIMSEDGEHLRQRMKSLVNWLRKCVAEPLGFVERQDNQAWKYVPSFGPNEICTLTTNKKCYLGEDEFKNYLTEVAAKVAEKIFKTFDSWDETKKDTYHKLGNDKKSTCQNLLYISAARHVYLISILYQLSIQENNGKKILTCQTEELKKDTKYVIPSEMEYCYPVNYGSLDCTSDEDVGLIGKKAGILVKAFNEYFDKTFEKTSEQIMDTNVYAYSLEYAMPSLFIFQGDEDKSYQENMLKKDSTQEYKIQDITVALYKIKKYDEVMFDGFKMQFNDFVLQLKTIFDRRMEVLEALTNFYPLSEKGVVESYSFFTNALANSVQTTEQLDRNMRIVLYSLLYASEGYHSRGALRVVVGSMQMEKIFITKTLDVFDF